MGPIDKLRALAKDHNWCNTAVLGEIEYDICYHTTKVINDSNFGNDIISISGNSELVRLVLYQLEMIANLCCYNEGKLMAMGGMYKGKEWAVCISH